MIEKLKQELLNFYPEELIEAFLDSYEELTGNFVRGKLRPTEVAGGRFCEAVIRMLQYETTGTYSPIGTSVSLDNESEKLKNLLKDTWDDSLRLHIPRTMRVIYDIRNKRDTAHLGKISPNIIDATLVLNCCKWILAELFRLKFEISIPDAQIIIDNIAEKDIPSIQNFGGFPVILRPELSARDRIMLLLYNRGAEGASRNELSSWLPPKMSKQIATNLSRLQYDRCFIHRGNEKIFITLSGEKYVEDYFLPSM